MKKIKYFLQYIIILFLFIIFKILGLKYSSILRNSKTIFRLIQMDNNKSLTKQIKNAVKNNCDILVIVGEDEIRNNTLTIKYLKSNRDDNTIDLDSFTNFINECLDE